MMKKAYNHNRGQVLFGLIVISLGVFFLLDNLISINIGAYFWPLVLIGLGVWLLTRPQLISSDAPVTWQILGEIERRGSWLVQDESFQTLIGDVDLDMTKADIPKGDTHLRFANFVGEVKLFAPEDVGVYVSSAGFVNEVRLNEDKQDSFLGPVQLQSKNYETAERRVHVYANGFINDVKVRLI